MSFGDSILVYISRCINYISFIIDGGQEYKIDISFYFYGFTS